ncbi:HAMP domain-containing sensor histidine kinase [Clostridium oceanicum]
MRKYLQSTYEKVPECIINGQYSKLESENILGKEGFFEVIDDNNNVIYPKVKSRQIRFSTDKIDLIPKEDNRPIITKEVYREFDSKKYTELTFEYYQKLKKTYQTIVVVDENFNLVFSDVSKMRKKFSKEEFDLLRGVYDDTYEVSKLLFTNNEGKSYSIIFFREYNPMNMISKSFEGTLVYCLVIFIILFIVYALIYLINLDKKVKVPLNLLGVAIERFSLGEKEKLISYKGPYEFENVCKNFNDMAVKLNEAEQMRYEAEEEKRKIIADISHDLKTPITVIQGFAKVLMDGKIEDNEKKKYLERIYIKSNSMAELINAFSEYSKLDRPDFRLESKKSNISEFVRKYFIDKYSELELLGYKLDINIPEYEIYCDFDNFQMKRVFNNIISNTMKYAPKGTIISFSVEETEENVRLLLGDNGPGIPEELEKTIFEPFSVGNKSRTTGNGSGLGMAIVYKIIKAHGGVIKLTSDKNKKISVLYEIELPK